MRTSRLLPLLALVAVTTLAAPGHASSRVLLQRVHEPGNGVCESEGETAVTMTSAGRWVGYNRVGVCEESPLFGSRLAGLQLFPAGGGPARQIALPTLEGGWVFGGDPALAPDGAGVVFASLTDSATPQASSGLVSSGTTRLEVVRVAANGRAQLLPPVSRAGFDDKEAVAVDPRTGWVYVVWDDAVADTTVLRAFDGHRWLPRVTVADVTGFPDVAVAPDGRVAVAIDDGGVLVRVSRDRGATFGKPTVALAGADPGVLDATCAEPFHTVGVRQRLIKDVRLAWDRSGALHAVAALANGVLSSAVSEAVSHDGGRTWRSRVVATDAWAPAVAALPSGGVAIGYLQLRDRDSYEAKVFVRGATDTVSPAPARFPVGYLSELCYGIGDYTSLAARGSAVSYAWGTTDGTQLTDTDVLVATVG